MAFLVSTSQHILLADIDQKKLYRVHSGNGLYYGLSLLHGRLIAGCRNRPSSNCDSERALERGSLLFFDDRLNVTEELQPPFPMRDLHGIASHENNVFVTCAFDNLVAILDTRTRVWRKWYPSIDLTARERDVNHFNTISVAGERLALLAHNWGPSDILFYCYPSLELDTVHRLGVEAHNILFVSGSLSTCSSAEGLVVSEEGWRLRTGNFPRGFASEGRLQLLGLSRHIERRERSVADSVIRVFDDTWQFRADYVLRAVGMILDIVSIPIANPETLGLDRFEQIEISDQRYNPEYPGNSYFPGREATSADQWLEWHGAEGGHRWTASRNATMEIIINPGEKFLHVEAASEFPERYTADVFLNASLLGRMSYSGPAVLSSSFSLNGHPPGPARLSFEVPRLWTPADNVPGSRDFRALGIAVRSVRLTFENDAGGRAPNA